MRYKFRNADALQHHLVVEKKKRLAHLIETRKRAIKQALTTFTPRTIIHPTKDQSCNRSMSCNCW